MTRDVDSARRQRPATAQRRAILLDDARTFMAEACGDPDLDLSAVARAIATSNRQLQRVFAQLADSSFTAELRAVRMQRGAELLRSTTLPIGQIARSVGYRQPPQFAKAFRRRYGMSPSDFRSARPRDAAA